MGMQGLLLGAEGVEQVQGRLPVVSFVVPLQQHVQRNGDPAGLREHGARHETPGEQDSCRDTRFGHCQPDADGDHAPRVPDRAADPGQRKEGVQGGLPFRDRLVGQREDEGVDGLVADRLAGLHRPAKVGAGLLGGGQAGPVAASGELDGGRGEALRCGALGPSHQPGVHLAQPAGVAEQDQRHRCGYGHGSPQDAGDLAEGEFAFEDAAVETLFRRELHGRAFRECTGTVLPDDLTSDRDLGGEHPCRYCVHGYHLLDLSHGLWKCSRGRPHPPNGFSGPHDQTTHGVATQSYSESPRFPSGGNVGAECADAGIPHGHRARRTVGVPRIRIVWISIGCDLCAHQVFSGEVDP